MPKFDQIWVSNRFRYRKGMTGTGMIVDPATGYLEPATRRGFNGEMKKVFIDRFKVCSNRNQISKSLFINIQAIYDAIAVDEKFRNDFIACDQIEGRNKQLNNSLIELAASAKNQVISDLASRIDKYKII